jgi:hypothetical protein
MWTGLSDGDDIGQLRMFERVRRIHLTRASTTHSSLSNAVRMGAGVGIVWDTLAHLTPLPRTDYRHGHAFDLAMAVCGPSPIHTIISPAMSVHRRTLLFRFSRRSAVHMRQGRADAALGGRGHCRRDIGRWDFKFGHVEGEGDGNVLRTEECEVSEVRRETWCRRCGDNVTRGGAGGGCSIAMSCRCIRDRFVLGRASSSRR